MFRLGSTEETIIETVCRPRLSYGFLHSDTDVMVGHGNNKRRNRMQVRLNALRGAKLHVVQGEIAISCLWGGAELLGELLP